MKRRLASAGSNQGVKGACELTVDYFKVERYLLAMLYQLKPSDLLGKPSAKTDGIREKERELAGMAAGLPYGGGTRRPVPSWWIRDA